MINRNGRHALRLSNAKFTSLQPFVANVMLQRVKQHRLDVGGRGLEEVAEQIQVVLCVSERASRRHKLQNSRQAPKQIEILSVSISRARRFVASCIPRHPTSERTHIQLPHTRSPHELGHAVNNHDRIVTISFEGVDQSRRILTIHYMYDEN